MQRHQHQAPKRLPQPKPALRVVNRPVMPRKTPARSGRR